MPDPQIIMGWTGDADIVRGDLLDHTYQDLSTVIVMPTRGMIPARVVDSFMTLIRPPNAKATQLFIAGLEVGAAYNEAVRMIRGHPQLSTWRFMLTVEEDNLLPPDALLALQREMIAGRWDVLGALYWTKGFDGCPQIWGDPDDPEENYRPRRPADGVVACNGTGMGCTLFDLSVFNRLEAPWFETQVGTGDGLWTQDLHFHHRARTQNVALRVGVDCRIRVGHLDVETGQVW